MMANSGIARNIRKGLIYTGLWGKIFRRIPYTITMKILFLTDDFPPKNFGGAGIVTHTLATGLVEAGHELFVITTVQDPQKPRGWREQDGMKVFQLYNTYDGRFSAYVSLYNPKTVGIVKRVFKEIRPDVVHAHNIHNNISSYNSKPQHLLLRHLPAVQAKIDPKALSENYHKIIFAWLNPPRKEIYGYINFVQSQIFH